MMSAVLYIVLATATFAINAAEFENEPREAARAERDAWEIAWSVALYEHLAARRNETTTSFRKRKSPFSGRRDRSDAREIYGDA